MVILEEGGREMIYVELFLSFLKVGLFSVGGGYAAIPLIQSQVVEGKNWITMSEFTNLVTIAEMTPGPISVNSATFVGIRIAGIPGLSPPQPDVLLRRCLSLPFWLSSITGTRALLPWGRCCPPCARLWWP